MILDEAGRAPEACALYEDVLAARVAALGEGHVDALRTACNLGILRVRLGDVDGAVALLRRTREASARTLGADDELSLASAHNLSEALVAAGGAGDLAEARGLAASTLESRRRVFGVEHPHALRSSLDLARLLRRISPVDGEARALLEGAVGGYRRSLGAGHPRTARAAALLAQWTSEDGGGAAKEKGAPAPVSEKREADAADGRERLALVSDFGVADALRGAALDALAAALEDRGVAAVLCPRPEADRGVFLARAGAAIVGVATLDGEARFAYRLDLLDRVA